MKLERELQRACKPAHRRNVGKWYAQGDPATCMDCMFGPYVERPEMETYRVKVCRVCGAEYSTAASTRHIHQGSFKTVVRERPKQPSRITYQPGHAPKGDKA